MKKSLFLWQFGGFIFTSVMGTFLHFAYDWSGQNSFFALFSAVNESIWEHMKLLFFPMFTFALIESYFLWDEYEDFWCVKFKGIVSGLVLIPVLYYSYTGILGIMKDFINIAIFFLASAFTYIKETRLFKQGPAVCASPQIVLLLLFLIALIFVVFTFYPPQIPLFEDPTGSFNQIS